MAPQRIHSLLPVAISLFSLSIVAMYTALPPGPQVHSKINAFLLTIKLPENGTVLSAHNLEGKGTFQSQATLWWLSENRREGHNWRQQKSNLGKRWGEVSFMFRQGIHRWNAQYSVAFHLLPQWPASSRSLMLSYAGLNHMLTTSQHKVKGHTCPCLWEDRKQYASNTQQ